MSSFESARSEQCQVGSSPVAGKVNWLQKISISLVTGFLHPLFPALFVVPSRTWVEARTDVEEVLMSDDGGGGFGWFLAGLGLGALIGVLYAPKSGRETREDILRGAEEGREYVANRARQARVQADQWVDRGRDVIQKQKDQFSAAVEAGRQAYHEATETGVKNS